MKRNLTRTLLAAAFAGLFATGCTSNGTEGSDGGITNTGGAFPPGGGTPTTGITEGGTPLTGNFTCTGGVRTYGGPTTQIGSNGLLGGPLTNLLNLLGGSTLTQLLNSVISPERVIDGDLATFASFNLTAGLLGGLLTSVDETVSLTGGKFVPSGRYAVFAVSFPAGTATLSLINSVKVTTFRNGAEVESSTYDQTQLSLLGLGIAGTGGAFIGLKATSDFDAAQVSLTPGLLSVSVGDAMHVHELCTDGTL